MITPERRIAYIEFIHRFFFLFDSSKYEELEKCMSDQISYDVGSITGEAASLAQKSDLLRIWSDGLSHHKALHHQISNHVLEVVNPNLVKCFCYGNILHDIVRDNDQQSFMEIGWYELDLEIQQDEILLSGFRFNERKKLEL